VFKKVSALVNSLVGMLVTLVFLSLLGTAGWLGARAYLGARHREELANKLAEREAEIKQLNVDLAAKQVQIDRLEVALRLLKVDHRVAQIDVLGQQGSVETKTLVTSFSFVELDDKGEPLDKPRVFTVKGDVIYVDALVVKFTDESVEAADPLRSTSSCLFRRIYGEEQQPNEGFVLDPVGAQPARYRSGEKISEFEREIWARFWEYSNNPAEAEKKGIRAAHGEAPFQKVVPGKRYRVELRASGGLSFVPEAASTKPPGRTY
jgi:uncharacterized coiled-coil protein SlyX